VRYVMLRYVACVKFLRKTVALRACVRACVAFYGNWALDFSRNERKRQQIGMVD